MSPEVPHERSLRIISSAHAAPGHGSAPAAVLSYVGTIARVLLVILFRHVTETPSDVVQAARPALKAASRGRGLKWRVASESLAPHAAPRRVIRAPAMCLPP